MTKFQLFPLGLLSLVFLGLVGCGAERPESFSWQVEETHRWSDLTGTTGESPSLQRLDSTDTGIGFVNELSTNQYIENRHLVNGSGAAVGDVTGDGWPDLYLARLDGPNVLYANEGDGNLRFDRVSQAGGAALPDQFSTGAVLEDVTGSGHVDLLVTTLGGPNFVFENNGQGQFRAPDTLHTGRGSTTMTLADVSGNRALDLYVANYKDQTVKDIYSPSERQFDQVVEQTDGAYRVRNEFKEHYELRRQGNRLMRFESGESDRMYFNNGDGTFTEQAWTSVFRSADGSTVATTPQDWGLVARLEDLNGDGTPDLYVCNDFESPDFYYRGVQGEGRFRAAPEEALRTTSHSSMSIATTDVERTGTVDFFVADMLGQSYERRQQQVGVGTPIPRAVGDETERMQEMLNTFQVNRGDGTYVQKAHLSGVEASGWTWATSFVDVNLDGYEDLLAANGHAYDAMRADTQMRLRSQGGGRAGVWREDLLRYPRLDQKNVAFRNEGDGTFRKMEDGWGLGETADVSHGMATGDFDGDGDQDVVINRLNRPVGIYRNEGQAPRLAVRLAGRAPNTGGIGAKVEVTPEGGAVPVQETSVIAGGEYVSDSGETLTFAMGKAEAATIRVEWPTGEETVVEGQEGRMYEIRQPGAKPEWTNDTGGEGE
jgi:hypothetical protein